MRSSLENYYRLLGNAILVAFAVGAVDGALAWSQGGTRPQSVVTATLFGAAVIAVLGVPIATGEWIVLGLARACNVGPIRKITRRAHAVIRLASSRAPHVGRSTVVSVHAAALASALVLAAISTAYWLLIQRVLRLQVSQVQSAVLVIAGVLALLGAPVLAFALAALFRPAIARVDRWVRLPLPPWRGSRLALFVCLPLLFAVFAVYTRLEPYVPVMRWPLLLCGFVLLQLLFAACVQALRSALSRRSKRSVAFGRALPSALLPVVVALFAYTGHITTPTSDTLASLSAHGVIGANAIEWARLATDFDRDGDSHWFGGLDCGGMDPHQHPNAVETPANGRDEDCDGLDPRKALAAVAPVPKLEPFSRRFDAAKVRHYNIVWVVIDAVRADHTSLLGYARKTTPYLELLAKESLVFTRAYSQSSATVFSLPSAFTGVNPTNLSWQTMPATEQPADYWHDSDQLQLAQEHETAAELFGSVGYRTAINMSTYMVRSHHGVQQGYERVLDLWIAHHLKWGVRSSPVATMQAIQLIEDFRRDRARPKSPFFLTVYYEDPHAPYMPHTEGYPKFGTREVDKYDGEIAFADRHVGFLYEYLRHQPELWDNTVFVVIADHGEEFQEHGFGGHSRTCHIESVHVPLLIRIPGVPAQRIDAPVALLDVLPTLNEITGVRQPKNRVDGQSLLVPALAPELLTKSRPIFCAVAKKSKGLSPFFTSSVRVQGSMLTYYLPFGRLGLYDTAHDPREQADIFSAKTWTPAVKTLRAWLRHESTGNLPQTMGLSDGDG